MGQRGEVYSTKTSIGKRTYFFNVKENRHGDLFLNIVESKKAQDSMMEGPAAFERQSVIVFQEDMEAFLDSFQKAIDFLRTQKKGSGRPSV